MTRIRTREEVRRLKERGLFDPGRTYVKIGGFSKVPKYVPWDELYREDEDPAHDEDGR